ncbi:MAG: hypothetical protein V4537_03320 [Pseudomonadota bacterium]
MTKSKSPSHGHNGKSDRWQINPNLSFEDNLASYSEHHCTINQQWVKMTGMAGNFSAGYTWYSQKELIRFGILRDTRSVDWSIRGLERACQAVCLTQAGLDESGAIAPDPAQMAASWVRIRRCHQVASDHLMAGRLQTGFQMVLAADAAEAPVLADILAFHALDSAYRAAEDGRQRFRDPFQIAVMQISGDSNLRNFAYARSMRQNSAQAREVRQIFDRSRRTGNRANERDTERMTGLGYLYQAAEQRAGMDATDARLRQSLGQQLKDGEAHVSQIMRTITAKQSRQWNPQEVHRALGTPALQLLWNHVDCAAHVYGAECVKQVATGVSDDGRPVPYSSSNSWAEDIVKATAAGRPPADLMPQGYHVPAELARLLFHFLRIDVVQDEDAIPRKFWTAARERANGNPDPIWQEPYTSEKVIMGLAHEGKSHGSRFLVEASKEASAMLRIAAEEPTAPRNARILAEAQGRLWFRLRL